MKRILRFCFVMLVVAAYMPANAQDVQRVPHWVPTTGYWVAENNAKEPKQCTIYFYTNENVLVYKENIEGVKLNLGSRKVKMRLKKVLETSLQAWQKQQKAKENEGLVISLLNRK